MGAWIFVLLCLVCWALPLASDDWIFALGWTFIALVALVVIQWRTRKLLIAKLLGKSKQNVWFEARKSSRNSWTVTILVEISFPPHWRFKIEGWFRSRNHQLPDIRSAAHWQPSQLPDYAMHYSLRFRRDNLDTLRPDRAIARRPAGVWSNQHCEMKSLISLLKYRNCYKYHIRCPEIHFDDKNKKGKKSFSSLNNLSLLNN